jgi:3,4-dihydroxy 2-butanone 4-phosphate synthase/GTP cyclohydrolase II
VVDKPLRQAAIGAHAVSVRRMAVLPRAVPPFGGMPEARRRGTVTSGIPEEVSAMYADRVERAVENMRAGQPVLLSQGEDEQAEGALVIASRNCTPEPVSFLVRHTSGFLRVAIEPAVARSLDLPLMSGPINASSGHAYGVSVDAKAGMGTGISATDRSRTISLLADPGSDADDFTRPGHIVTVRAEPAELSAKRDTATAGMVLARHAGLGAACAFAELISQLDPGELARGSELLDFAEAFGVPLVSVQDLISYEEDCAGRLTRLPENSIRIAVPEGGGAPHDGQGSGESRRRERVLKQETFTNAKTGARYTVLISGDWDVAEAMPLALHSLCLAGQVFGACDCGCRPALDASLAAIVGAERGILVMSLTHTSGPGFDSNEERHNSPNREDDLDVAEILRMKSVKSICSVSRGVITHEIANVPTVLDRAAAEPDWLERARRVRQLG